jgi:hypothetical protein
MIQLTPAELGISILLIAGSIGMIAFQTGFTIGSLHEKKKVVEYSFKNTMNMVNELIRDLYPLRNK